MNSSREYAYVRVSSTDQNISRQIAAMEELNIPQKNIFVDKKSGKNFERPAYQKLIKKLQKGDVVFIKSIDRLGRNYDDILEQWRIITKVMEVDIVVIDMPLLDTRSKDRDLAGALIADMVLQILSFVAQSERDNIRQRQKEGIEQARKRGVKFGHPRTPLPETFPQMLSSYKRDEITVAELARLCGVHRSTMYRRL